MKPFDCPLAEEQLTAFLDEDLPAEQMRAVARHVMACSHCSELLGRLRAAQTVMDLPHPTADSATPSPDLWDRVNSRLDEVDRLMQATPSVAEGLPRPYLYRLVAVGAGLILLAVVVQQVMLHTISGVPPTELVAMHNQAAASVPAATASGYTNISLGGSSQPATTANPAMVELDGAPALWLQYAVGGRRVSVLCTGRHSVNLRGMQQLAAYGKQYHLKQTPAGNVLVDSSGDIWRVAISNATPQEMLPVLRQLPEFLSYRTSM